MGGRMDATRAGMRTKIPTAAKRGVRTRDQLASRRAEWRQRFERVDTDASGTEPRRWELHLHNASDLLA